LELKKNIDSTEKDLKLICKKIDQNEHEKKMAEKNSDTNKSLLIEKVNEKQKELIQLESELKNLQKNLDLLEKDIYSSANLKKANQTKISKLFQMFEFSSTQLKEQEASVKEKKIQLEDVKRSAKENKGIEEAAEGVERQIKMAEKKKNEVINHRKLIDQKLEHNRRELQGERAAYENSLISNKNEKKQVELLQEEIQKLEEEINGN
jgi:murein hydrolase activator